MTSVDNAELEEWRDKCYMIIEAVEDECKKVESASHMRAAYVYLKDFYRGVCGVEALRELVNSFEPRLVMDFNDTDDGSDEEPSQCEPERCGGCQFCPEEEQKK